MQGEGRVRKKVDGGLECRYLRYIVCNVSLLRDCHIRSTQICSILRSTRFHPPGLFLTLAATASPRGFARTSLSRTTKSSPIHDVSTPYPAPLLLLLNWAAATDNGPIHSLLQSLLSISTLPAHRRLRCSRRRCYYFTDRLKVHHAPQTINHRWRCNHTTNCPETPLQLSPPNPAAVDIHAPFHISYVVTAAAAFFTDRLKVHHKQVIFAGAATISSFHPQRRCNSRHPTVVICAPRTLQITCRKGACFPTQSWAILSEMHHLLLLLAPPKCYGALVASLIYNKVIYRPASHIGLLLCLLIVSKAQQ